MTETSRLETDYLVIGAGALGMAFVDSLIEGSDAEVVMVERRHRPAFDKLEVFAAHATPQERARMFEPGASTGA